MALPLGCVDDLSIRSRLDLAVVTSGHRLSRSPTPGGHGRPNSSPRPWMSPLSGCCPAVTRAVFEGRTLPVRFDARHGGGRNRSARLAGATAEQALGLAASLLLAAEDRTRTPYAGGRDPRPSGSDHRRRPGASRQAPRTGLAFRRRGPRGRRRAHQEALRGNGGLDARAAPPGRAEFRKDEEPRQRDGHHRRTGRTRRAPWRPAGLREEPMSAKPQSRSVALPRSALPEPGVRRRSRLPRVGRRRGTSSPPRDARNRARGVLAVPAVPWIDVDPVDPFLDAPPSAALSISTSTTTTMTRSGRRGASTAPSAARKGHGRRWRAIADRAWLRRRVPSGDWAHGALQGAGRGRRLPLRFEPPASWRPALLRRQY